MRRRLANNKYHYIIFNSYHQFYALIYVNGLSQSKTYIQTYIKGAYKPR